MATEDSNLNVAVLSGKGGTGKTLVSVNLATVTAGSVYIDCDVEEPNGHLFFKPMIKDKAPVTVKIPIIDADKCTGCRKCVSFCAFHALAFVKGRPILFNDVCHSCGGCALLCPAKAINEQDKIVGNVFSGISDSVEVHYGSMNIGETSGIPVIKCLLDKISGDKSHPVFIDCPPGSSCAVMESIRITDFCVLIAEPTVFGAHNLAMVYELVKLLGKPYGVILNKYTEGENPSEEFCIANGISILGRIPFDPVLGAMNSEGIIVARENDQFKTLFSSLAENINRGARDEAAFNPQR
jgi:MinD superfamily P-loop ATPase containing an inserted ferredoxin domain